MKGLSVGKPKIEFDPISSIRKSLRVPKAEALRGISIATGKRVGLAGAFLKNVQARPTKQARTESIKMTPHLAAAEGSLREFPLP